MAWVIDLDGVVWLGRTAVPGSAAAVASLLAAGEQVLFVTNSAYRTVEDVEAELARHGIDGRGRVLTSAVAAASLVDAGERVLCLGGPGLRAAVAARGATVVDEGPADAVAVGFHPDFDFAGLDRAARSIRAGARFIASNLDATYPTDEGLLPGSGAIVAAVATAAGREPQVAGKPHEPLRDVVWDRVGREGIVVGDRPDTDGTFAAALGYRFALVLTGVTSEAQLPLDPAPDLVAADLAAVVSALT